jgi:hypothetical protein
VDKFSDALEDERRDLCELFLTEGDCLSESTEITVIRNGEQLDKTVGAVKVGDLVLTHKNHYQPISAISYGIKEVLKINTPLGPISVSPDHRLLAYSSILNNFEWVKAKDLDVNIHKLTRSTLVDILHAEITEIMINDGQYIINYQLGDKLEAYESSPTHKFSVFDITTLEYKILMAKDLDKDHHFLTFRYKYNVYDRRTDNENTIHDQRVP